MNGVGLQLLPGAAITSIVYSEDFESGQGGFSVNNSGGTLPGLWHYSLGRHNDGLSNHSLTHNFYYGLFESSTGGGRYDTLPADHQGVLISPLLQMPTMGTTTLSFNYLLDTRPDLNVDFVTVSVDDGSGEQIILSRNNGTLPQTGREQWLTSTADLSPFAGKQIQLRFSFDTGDFPSIDPEGWYVDDIIITNSKVFEPDISGYKWNDQDGDGVWDATEPGLNGWTIYLDADNDNVLDAGEKSFVTQNDGQHDGAYWFADLPAGTYTVREVVQPNWKQTYPGAPNFEHVVIIDPPNGVRVHGDFGQAEPPNFGNVLPDISGYKWNDQDGDGVWDATEPGLNGWTIYLDADNDNVLDAGEKSFVTQNDGQHDGAYWFADLPAGTYTVREVVQPNWKQTYPGAPNFEHVVIIDPPNGVRVHGDFGQAEPPNFGNVLPDISGYKWNDQDGDGVWDATEPGLNGWTIYLDADNDNVLDAGEKSFVTQNDGQHDGAYWFADLPAGTYTVREVVQPNWKQTYPGAPNFEHVVIIDPPNGVRVHGDFGQAEPPNFGNVLPDISGYKWNDQDGDGVWDATEPGLNGWTIYLDADNDNVLDAGEKSFVTQNDGQHDGAYWFADLPAGTYTVREVVQPNWKQTYPGAPNFEHVVIIDPPNGVRVHGDFGQAEPPNFGNVLPDISGYKWNDVNPNGVGTWQAGESGQNGRIIYLDLDDDDTLSLGDQSFVTQNDGQHDGAYWFVGLAGGTYTVREAPFDDQTYPGSPAFEHVVTINPVSGVRVHGDFEQAEPPNFGDTDLGSTIAGIKFDDRNGNGVQDNGEGPLGGWEFRMFKDDDDDGVLDANEIVSVLDPWQLATTNATSGVFQFNTQPPTLRGRYILVEVLINGFTQIQVSGQTPVNPTDPRFGRFGYVVDVLPGFERLDLDFANKRKGVTKRDFLASIQRSTPSSSQAAASMQTLQRQPILSGQSESLNNVQSPSQSVARILPAVAPVTPTESATIVQTTNPTPVVPPPSPIVSQVAVANLPSPVRQASRVQTLYRIVPDIRSHDAAVEDRVTHHILAGTIDAGSLLPQENFGKAKSAPLITAKDVVFSSDVLSPQVAKIRRPIAAMASVNRR